MTKSVLSTLIGQAIGDGLISELDAPLGDLLPDYREVMTRDVAAVTLRQVLTMSGGFVGDPPEDVVAQLDDPEFDLTEWALTEGHPNPPGTFEVSNVGARWRRRCWPRRCPDPPNATGGRSSSTPGPGCSTRWASSPSRPTPTPDCPRTRSSTRPGLRLAPR